MTTDALNLLTFAPQSRYLLPGTGFFALVFWRCGPWIGSCRHGGVSGCLSRGIVGYKYYSFAIWGLLILDQVLPA